MHFPIQSDRSFSKAMICDEFQFLDLQQLDLADILALDEQLVVGRPFGKKGSYSISLISSKMY